MLHLDELQKSSTGDLPVSSENKCLDWLFSVICCVEERLNILKMGCGCAACGVSGALYTLILCLTGCSCLYSCFYRSKLRGQYLLEESPCVDCCVHCWFEGCALCQEYRELQNRGFDLSIGLSLSPFSQLIFCSLNFCVCDLTRVFLFYFWME